MRDFNFFCCAGLVAALLFSFSTDAWSQSVCVDPAIDDFANTTVGRITVNAMMPNAADVDDGSPGVLGTFRNLELGPASGPQDVDFGVVADIGLTFSNDAFSSAPARVIYSADGAGLGANIAFATGINLAVDSADQAVDLTITLEDAATNQASFAVSLDDADADSVLSLALADFNGINALNRSNIFSISLSLDPQGPSADYLFTSFDFVCPELPPANAVPSLNGGGLMILTLLMLMLGVYSARKLLL